VIATRLHLGNAAAPPDTAKLERTVAGFAEFCAASNGIPVIAVDATPKMEHYDHVQAVQEACEKYYDNNLINNNSNNSTTKTITVLPVTPWGKFVPALNALIAHAITITATSPPGTAYILFVSAETRAPRTCIEHLCREASADDTLVAGALLAGHDYHDHHDHVNDNDKKIPLTGRTTPWNTLAVWKLSKLALTGFPLVSDGLLTDSATEPSYGVEEVAAIALLQKLLGADHARAKLVKCAASVEWDSAFDQDDERRQWHETKMKSKVERAERQLQLLGLHHASGSSVHHC
jgi:hypothetical protein